MATTPTTWTVGAATMTLLAAGLLSTCVSVEEPPCPPVELTGTGGECGGSCGECSVEEMKGRVFRMTSLEIDEPQEFADLLNTMWRTDIDNQTLNVLFYVDIATRTDEELGPFSLLEFVAGPAWRTPKLPLALLQEEKGPTPDEQVDSYCILDGLESALDGEPYHGKLCEFKSLKYTSLFFHSGPKDQPLVCAPANVPANTIPIKNLKARMPFNEDCTEIQNAFLEGCITIPDADHICMCLKGTGNCDYVYEDGPEILEGDAARAPWMWPYGWQAGEDAEDGGDTSTYWMLDEDGEPIKTKKPILEDYCAMVCGKDWVSFGGVVNIIPNMNPTCQTPDGRPGYRIQGFFNALTVTEKFNPVQSADCTED
ncbi:MAG: hypothetical protein ABIK09_20750 [Pseudomonadota bacterium]